MQIRATLIAAVVLAAVACVGPGPETTGRIQQRLDVCAVSPDGALCDDGKICTTPDLCKGGICVGTVRPDGMPCTTGDVCQIRNSQVCKAGMCVGTPAPDGYPCLDDDPCTDPDTCLAGKCQPGPPKVCDDGDTCTVDSCLTGTGCVATVIPECTHPVDAADGPSDADGGDAADAPADRMDAEVIPVDAPMDMMSVDVPAIDMTVDMSPVDVVRPDVPDSSPMDTPLIDVSIDMSSGDLVDVISPADRGDTSTGEAGDLPADSAKEVAPDTAGDTVSGDARIDLAVDGVDAADDQGETPPDLRARGGACLCSASEGASPPGTLLLGLILAVAWGRRRSSTRPE